MVKRCFGLTFPFSPFLFIILFLGLTGSIREVIGRRGNNKIGLEEVLGNKIG